MTPVASALRVGTAPAAAAPPGKLLARACACGTHAVGGECSSCRDRRLQRRSETTSILPQIPDSVYATLDAPGHGLDARTRDFMETRFGHDFSGVRVHTDTQAASSAHAISASAYTVGHHIVFGAGRFSTHTNSGRMLLAHELTHVVQQGRTASAPSTGALRIDDPGSAGEKEADRVSAAIGAQPSSVPSLAQNGTAASVHHEAPAALISRANAAAPDSVDLTTNLGRTPRTGVQFSPSHVADTRVGPVSAQPGLLSSGGTRLNVIVGEDLTLNTLAVELLPLWTTATPFTPPGAAAPLPLDIITADELARGLLVYNQNYLPVPAMTRWRAGLRLSLPVDIDSTGVATLHPLQIRALASAFQAAWAPQLDLHATANQAPSAASLQADVATFLSATPSALGRGIALGARALTNALAERPVVHESLRQLGAGAFDVALAFMDNLVDREVAVLAAQRDGFGILTDVLSALAAAPAAPSPAQKASLNRVNALTATILVGASTRPPDATRKRAEKTVSIDTVKLDGTNRDPAADMRLANTMFAQCNVRLNHSADKTASTAQTNAWIGADHVVDAPSCSSISAEQRKLSQGAKTDFGLNGRIRVFYAQALASKARASSCPPAGADALVKGVTWIGNDATDRTLAHELGHQLIDSGAGVDDHTKDTTRLLATSNDTRLGETLNDRECNRAYKNA